MKLVIADPPYLGRARRWYGEGRGHSGGRGRADLHDESTQWDTPEAHMSLIEQLEETADGWAVAMSPDSLPLYLAHVPTGTRVAVWARANGIPSGSRIRAVWEPVLVKTPKARIAHGTGASTDDLLTAGIPAGGFAGRKPEAWTHWVLDMLGYDPALDVVEDLFAGTGAVSDAIATYPHRPIARGRRRDAPPVQAQQVRRTARASRGKRAAVLAALRAGGSVRAVAADARISTNTVQRWKREAQGSG
jgi:hypothetical protein